MSVSLTNRATDADLTMNVSGVEKEGLVYQASENTPTVQNVMKVRHSSSGAKNRHNHQNVLKVYDETTRKWFAASVDRTVSLDSGYNWTAAQIDDLLTQNNSYLASEAETGGFISGVSKT